MSGAVSVELPGGHWIDGVCHREAQLHPLTGEDEAFLSDTGDALLPAQRTTMLLARCLTRLGPVDKVTPEIVRSLTVGDREALLLHLRRLTLGERLQCVLSCPDATCGKTMDLELEIGDLLLPPYPSRNDRGHEMTVADDGVSYTVRFRTPTGADAEAVAYLALSDPQAAADELVRRCLDAVRVDGQPFPETPPVVTRALPARLSEVDPQAELVLNLTCPECHKAFSALFDIGVYFFKEIAAGIRRLYREVHFFAFYYHWSEAEILRMTHGRRQRYLGLLTEALGR